MFILPTIYGFSHKKVNTPTGNYGTLSSGATWSTDVPLSGFGSIAFTGATNSKVTLYNNTANLYNDQSLSIWFKVNSFGGIILGNTGIANHYIQIASSTIIYASINGSEGTYQFSAMSTGVWYNLVFSRVNLGSNFAKMYINNVESNFGSQSQGASYFDINVLGQYFDGTATANNFDGKLADFRKFDSILTSTDRINLAAGNEPVTNSSFHLKMNEGSGTTAWDYIM